MGKAGGVIGILAGVFGVIAATVTLLVGGVGSAFEAESAKTVVGLGWGGVAFSFLAITFGAVALARPRGGGIGLIVSAILGAILGGTLVAVCMVLALVGGILAVVVKQPVSAVQRSDQPATSKGKLGPLVWGGGLALVIVLLAVVFSSGNDKQKPDPLGDLANAQPSSLKPEGELSELFALGSKATNVQRENKMIEIQGQVVAWTLPVYEVKRRGEKYIIQTKTGVSFGSFGSELLGTFITLTPRTDEERRQIEALKTDDMFSFRGRIAGTTFRSLDINPAILASSRIVAAPANDTSVTNQDEGVQPNTQQSTALPPPQTATSGAVAQANSEVETLIKYKVSFDCTKASTNVERLLCSDRKLSQFDGLLAETYKDRMNNPAFGVDKGILKRQQIDWIKIRNACTDAACIAKAYRARIDDLCGMPVVSGVHQIADCDEIEN